MAASAHALGETVAQESIFRAYSEKGHRDRKSQGCASKPRAFYREQDDIDGISVGLSPDDAVNRLNTNFGYASLSVQAVIGIPGAGLEVRLTPVLPGHAAICNVPFINGNDEERERARLLAGQLARISICATADSHQPARN
jgi:hypothetical protein